MIAAAGDFVGDEMFHAELASRVAMALGGGVSLQVEFDRLARPSSQQTPLMRAAELIVRTCCVGEALTVPVLNQSRRAAGSATVQAVITRILRDEAQHAELGDLCAVFGPECARGAGLGTLDCARFDGTFLEAVRRNVVRPLAERGIVVPVDDLEHVQQAAA